MPEPRIVEIEAAAVQAMVERAKGRLSPEDYELLAGLVQTLLTLIALVRKGRTTIARLRRWIGMTSTEKTARVLETLGRPKPAASGQEAEAAEEAGPGDDGPAMDNGGAPAKSAATEACAASDPGADSQPASKRKGHGRTPASAYPDACQFEVLHESLRPGDRCPACGRGTLFDLKQPARFLRIVGQPPLVALCWNCQRLRCSGCGSVFTARAPEPARGDKHSETAAAMMAMLRYGGGMPLHRLEQLQRHLVTPVAAATQWEVVHGRVEAVKPVHRELCRLAAQGTLVHNDDTYMRILELMGRRRAALLRGGALPDPERTGLFTTAIVAIAASRPIALFFTGRKHAGENLSELLDQRSPELGPPLLMCDALERNLPQGHRVIESNCLAHGRRHFVDQVENFPAECGYLLEQLGRVFQVDELCHRPGLSPDERLRMHQRECGPVMDGLMLWMKAQLADKRVEPNSGLGQAIRYMLRRWDKLTLFLRVAGAPLHNNIVERALKKAIRHRRNSLFYRNQRGATVGDIYMALIHTTELHGGNAFHYLTALMRHPAAVAHSPGTWLPWNYRDTLALLETGAAA